MRTTRATHVSVRRALAGIVLAGTLLAPLSAERPQAPAPSNRPTIAQILKPGLPIELVSARKVDRIAWISYEEGRRNVFTAAGPTFRPVRVTAFMQDDGNFVVKDSAWNTLWASNTWGHSGAYAVVQNDGNLVVYGAPENQQGLWASGTGG